MSELWNGISELVKSEGLELFDIEIPKSPKGGVLRVFISQPASSESKAIHHTHCVAVSHKLLDWPELDRLAPEDVSIEVPSPGINRKLSRPEHFDGAKGERVKIKLRQAVDGEYTWIGQLVAFDGKQVTLEVPGRKEALVLAYENVAQARVDFKF